MPWGYHLILDCYECNPNLIRDKTNITSFARSLVDRIDMKAYGEPQVIHFGSDDKAGYTLVQLIETSNICAHFAEESNTVYLDVFSCKLYKINDVLEVVKEFFDPKRIRERYVERE